MREWNAKLLQRLSLSSRLAYLLCGQHRRYADAMAARCNRKTQQKAHEDYQALTLGMEKALEQWVDTWDERGFPPRLDLFKAVAAQLAERRVEEEGDPSLAELGPTWF